MAIKIKRRRVNPEIEAVKAETELLLARQKVIRMSMRIVGVSMVAGAALVIATKRIFDEIFLEDDWSDVDWGEEDEEDFVID